MEERKKDIYGDNFVDDYPPYWETAKFLRRETVNTAAVVYGVGLALSITFVALILGYIWAQAVESVVLNYSFLVDLTLAGSVLFGAYKGAGRAGTLGLVHGALVGLGYSITGILILAVAVSINWVGAFETVVIASLLGALGGVAGLNINAQPAKRTQPWPSKRTEELSDNYDDFLTRP